MEYPKLLQLTVPFAQFKSELEDLLEKGAEINSRDVSHEAAFSTQSLVLRDWGNQVIGFLSKSFAELNNEIKTGFYNTGAGGFQIPGAQQDWKQKAKQQKDGIGNKLAYLRHVLRTLEVCDAIARPKEVDLEYLRNLDTDEKLSLILNKLYLLYDDSYYSVTALLAWNGILMNRQGEDRELAKMLEDRGLIEVLNYGSGVNAQLTQEGKHLVEKGKRTQTQKQAEEKMLRNKIFISHGRSKLWMEVERFLEKDLRLETVVVQDQPNHGQTIIEKLEKGAAECNYAIIIMTAEDEQAGGEFRARQNVVHEIGFCQGHFGRKNVLVLRQEGVEDFSNISGIVYEAFSGEGIKSTFHRIRKELETRS